MFQSTPPHGGRHQVPLIGNVSSLVSIHAPAWGATPISVLDPVTGSFQSTPPHGGRPLARVSFHITGWGFNPRPRMGGDMLSV